MKGEGNMTRKPSRRIRRLMVFHALWLASLFALVGWWAWLGLRQADRIHDLEMKLGLSGDAVQSHFARTQRMLIWEGGSFLALLLLAGGVLMFLYWRDLKRQRSLQAFFASVTHELRTPLTSIRLQAESLSDLMEPRPHEDERNLVRRLLEDVQRLEGQVERTLELARVEGGGKVHLQPVRLGAWLDRWVESWRETHGSRIQIRSQLEQDCLLQADPAAIQVIFRNLLENSLRHSRRESVHVELVSRVNGDGTVSVTCRDDGTGFAGDARTLGEPFEKGAQSQGAGVGLYLVRILMERMGGKAHFGQGPGFPVELRFRGSHGS